MAIWRLAGHREFFARRPEAAERSREPIAVEAPRALGVEEPEPAMAAA